MLAMKKGFAARVHAAANAVLRLHDTHICAFFQQISRRRQSG
jgi:hypothetical protein